MTHLAAILGVLIISFSAIFVRLAGPATRNLRLGVALVLAGVALPSAGSAQSARN